MKTLLTAIVMIAALTSCASPGQPGIGDGEVSQSERAVLRLTIRIAAAQVIDRYSGISPQVIVSITSDIREYVDLDGEVSIEGVREILASVRQQYGLSATEMVALDEIATLAKARLEERGITDATARLGYYLDWIEDTARVAQR